MKYTDIEGVYTFPTINISETVLRIRGNYLVSDNNPDPPLIVFDYLCENIGERKFSEIHLLLEFWDAAAVQGVFKLIRTLPIEDEVVHFYYDSDDPELLELGVILEGQVGAKFKLIENRKPK